MIWPEGDSPSRRCARKGTGPTCTVPARNDVPYDNYLYYRELITKLCEKG
jgi:hypothetical protein